MSEKLKIPTVVRERLKAATAAGAHPEPDQLVALSEHRLGAGERSAVMEHLAACEECRTVLALSTAETAEIPARRGPARPFTSSWRAWQWAGLVASAALIVAIATNYSAWQTPQSRAEIAQNAPAAAPAAKEELPTDQKQAAAAQPAREATKSPSTAGSAGKMYTARDKAAAQEPATPRAEIAEKKDRKAESFAYSPATSGAALASTPSNSVALGGAAAIPAAPPPPPAAIKGQMAASTMAKTKSQAEPSSANQPLRVTTAAPILTTDQLQSNVRTNVNAVSQGAVWRLHRGELQQSFDAGHNWTQVEVSPVAQQHWNAMATIGMNIWVGGNGSTIYHSTDGGHTWEAQLITPIAPDDETGAAAARRSSADVPRITNIYFSDTDRGRATVFTPFGKQVFTTEDGGKHWTTLDD